MWTLVMWLFVVPGDLRSVSSVPGFSSKTACEAAGQHVARSILDGVKPTNARVGFVCVGS